MIIAYFKNEESFICPIEVVDVQDNGMSIFSKDGCKCNGIHIDNCERFFDLKTANKWFEETVNAKVKDKQVKNFILSNKKAKKKL